MTMTNATKGMALMWILWFCVIVSAKPKQAVKNLLFVTNTGHSSATIMSATAEELRNRANFCNITFLSYEAVRVPISQHLYENETVFFSGSPSPVDEDLMIQINQNMTKNSIHGLVRLMQASAKNYDMEVHELKRLTDEVNPDMLVIDFFSTSAIDYAHHAKIPFVVIYPSSVLGLFGYEDSLAMPDVTFDGSGLSELTLLHRLKRVWQFINTVTSTQSVTNYLNIKRSQYNFIQYDDPTTIIRNYPVLVTSFFGFDYPRSISPLTRMVGMYIDRSPYVKKPTSGHDKVVVQWLYAAIEQKISVVYIHFGTDAIVTKEQLHTLVNGVLLAQSKVIIAIRHEMLTALNLEYSDLILGREDNITVVPYVPSQMVLSHKAVNAYICHGGVLSIAEGIYNQVPMIMLPMTGERKAAATRVVDAKIGTRLDPYNLTAERVAEAVKYIQIDKVARRMRKRMGALKRLNEIAGEGDRGAAATIEEYLETGYTHLVPITNKLCFLSATGLDAYLIIGGAVLVVVYLAFKLLCLMCCGRKCSTAGADSVKEKEN